MIYLFFFRVTYPHGECIRNFSSDLTQCDFGRDYHDDVNLHCWRRESALGAMFPINEGGTR